ncbi:MAG: FAD-binding oxidoreductase [Pseudomonadota bacterium]
MVGAFYPSWGRVQKVVRDAMPLAEFERGASDASSLLAYGNGRSYGDSCHNDAGRLVDCRGHASIHSFDAETGLLQADAGILLDDLLAKIIPAGFFLPVTPGTRFVTLGGAVANDVHGKNHHAKGTLGCHVERFSLLRSDGVVYECSKAENPALFTATIGGLGLTGIILNISLRMMKVPSADVCQNTMRFSHLDAYFEQIEAVDADYEYSVAWIDQLATGNTLGRGVLMAANHADASPKSAPAAKARLSVPFQPPVNLLNRTTLTAFNALYYGRARDGERLVPWSSYFYPLDGINHWNRLYGPRGLFQHQSVYSFDNARETTQKLIECAQAHRHASFLTVLKCFGDKPSPGLLSFPRRGVTLTLDFANRGGKTLKMLDALDEIVMAAGGAINPYKDGRMRAETFAQSFPDYRKLEAIRDPAFVSDFWRRTANSLLNSDNH